MIKLLRLSNIAIVPQVEVELGPGFTVFTGETGAGKSILVDALGLVLGARATTEIIRSGEEKAIVEAVVDGERVATSAAARGFEGEDGEVILRREVQAGGKGRAFVNGALTPVSVLRELAPDVAAIHGQHEPLGLLDPDTHLPLLDHHAGLEAQAAEVAAAHRRMREAEAALQRFRADLRDAERRREMLAFQAKEIEEAALLPGEDESLRQEKQVQANAGKLAALSEEAYALLYEDESAVLTHLAQVYKRIEDLGKIDARFAPFLDGRLTVRAHLEDLAFFLRDYREQMQVSPGRLDAIEARLAHIERLERKYGATVDEVIAFGGVCRAELQQLGAPEERLKDLEAAHADASAVFVHLGQELSALRRKAAAALARRVESELADLAMEKTRFSVAFTPDTVPSDGGDPTAWTERGLESAEFLIAPNKGEEPRPLARIASGGELSRLMLALKSVASLDTPGVTLVFDEVDTGIGGRVAEVVGKKLRAMAARHQVLCVTHLPQIASLADHHLVVSKRVDKGRTRADVRSLDGPDRVEEVARMLGGETVTDTARKHAREMVRAARG